VIVSTTVFAPLPFSTSPVLQPAKEMRQ
jgi:hypothetical protein